MKSLIKEIKNGLGILLEELFLLIPKALFCIIICGTPSMIASIIPMLITMLILPEGANPLSHIVFKIGFLLFQILAVSVSISILDNDQQHTDDVAHHLLPSKDLVVAICILINVYVWTF